MIGLIRRVWNWRFTKWGDRVYFSLALGIVLSMAGVAGYTWGVFNSTGSVPGWYGSLESTPLITPVDAKVQTYDQVIAFLNEDDTDRCDYGEGFNCVEFALLVARNAEWKGISCDVFGINFVGEPVGHAIVGFPTTDKGWVFVEPQDDLVINPVPGTYYEGKKIRSVEKLVMDWSEVEWTN